MSFQGFHLTCHEISGKYTEIFLDLIESTKILTPKENAKI